MELKTAAAKERKRNGRVIIGLMANHMRLCAGSVSRRTEAACARLLAHRHRGDAQTDGAEHTRRANVLNGAAASEPIVCTGRRILAEKGSPVRL